jgi:anti-sigma factor ChrR (cupin superfamily)
MAPHLTLASLLLVFAAGMTAQVHAADQQASTLSREACALVRHDLDAVSARIREAMAEHAKVPMRAADYETLAAALDSHFEALHTNRPTAGTQRVQASVLLSDMRDSVALMRRAARLDARQLAVLRIEQDHRLYELLLKTLDCAETPPTPNTADTAISR